MVDNGEIDEGMLDRLKARGSSALSKAGSAVRGAGQSLGAKYTGAKAAVGSAVGANVDDLKKTQADQQQAAADTKTAGADKAEATKTLSILNSHLKALVNDLTKLGIPMKDNPGVVGAIRGLKQAVNGTIAKRAAEQ